MMIRIRFQVVSEMPVAKSEQPSDVSSDAGVDEVKGTDKVPSEKPPITADINDAAVMVVQQPKPAEVSQTDKVVPEKSDAAPVGLQTITSPEDATDVVKSQSSKRAEAKPPQTEPEQLSKAVEAKPQQTEPEQLSKAAEAKPQPAKSEQPPKQDEPPITDELKIKKAPDQSAAAPDSPPRNADDLETPEQTDPNKKK